MSEPDVSNLLSVAEAMAIIDGVPVSPRVVRRPLRDAIGLRLARDPVAVRVFPPFDKSQMDGYAVRAADVTHAPAELRVIGETAAGRAAERTISAGEAVAIMTGAPVPAGADCVVPVEDTTRQGDRVRI